MDGIIRQLPEDNPELVWRLSLRWMRAAAPHNEWAKTAKKCTDFLEGRHWTPEQKAKLNSMGRNALTLNRIAPLWRLVMGYQSSNRMDVNYLPTSDERSSEDVAEVLNALYKSEAGRTDLKFIDSEVFADGLTTGRGWWDIRLCWEENDFGENKIVASDPFSTYVDPDCSTYDIEHSAAYIQEAPWVDIDTVHSLYGDDAAEAVQGLTSLSHESTLLHYLGEQDISPVRFFGQYADDKAFADWNDVYYNDFVDHQAKRIRLLDTQYKMTSVKPCFVDMETGDKEPVPDLWLQKENQWMIQKALDYADGKGNPLKVVRRPVKRVRWTVTCGDILLHDEWSIYESYTKIGFFPYFRRGATRGFVEDLMDPQMEVNKKRSVMIDILNRSANSGWMYEEGTLDPDQEENLHQYGSMPGINVKWKRGTNNADRPQRIDPGQFPQGLDRLEQKAADDLFQISGVNESALGQLDRVQSGRAIEARQRQAVISIQLYTDNFARSKKIQGRKFLENWQNHYTEERMFRMIGEDSKLAEYIINQKVQGPNGVERVNDITVGKYSVEVDEVPISATFKQAQFEETMLLLEKLGPIGMALAQTSPELIVDQTSLPRKEDWKKGLMEATAMTPPQEGGTAGLLPPPTPVGPAAATPEGLPS